MQVRNTSVWITVAILLSGCGVFGGKQVDYKTGAVVLQPLEVPPDLAVPAVSGRAPGPVTEGTQVASYSDFARAPKVAETPCAAPQSAATTGTMQPAAAKLLQVGTTRFILLSEPFDRAWRSVGLALDRAGIKPADVDRSKGVYFLKLVDKDKPPVEAQLQISESAGISLVTVAGSVPAEAAASLLESVHRHTTVQ